MLCGSNKEENLKHASELVKEAVAAGANVVTLPECFNSPYQTSAFPEYAEDLGGLSVGSIPKENQGPSAFALSQMAKENQVYLIGGSIPEREGESVYNTCLVFGRDGSLLAHHRKIHLFDIDVPGGIKFKESDTLTGGKSLTSFETEYGKFGVGICYDIRFPELSQVMALDNGCDFLCFPGAFNMTTGPLHWELLARARAVDNQAYVAVVSPARNPDSNYQAWGHSSVIDPWAKVISTCEEKEAIIYADVDLETVKTVRQSIPVRVQRRKDLYSSPAAQ